jgi:hypothetical protein
LLKPYFATDIVAKSAKNAIPIPDGIDVALPSLLRATKSPPYTPTKSTASQMATIATVAQKSRASNQTDL